VGGITGNGRTEDGAGEGPLEGPPDAWWFEELMLRASSCARESCCRRFRSATVSPSPPRLGIRREWPEDDANEVDHSDGGAFAAALVSGLPVMSPVRELVDEEVL